ncbi:MAG: rRNA maturation RNase YbeY [Phycisphaerae bacterium]|nr:rRNA maturation RNase YbeY [Phycisphaerae bacterium]
MSARRRTSPARAGSTQPREPADLIVTVMNAPKGLLGDIRDAAVATLTSQRYARGRVHITIIGDAEMKRQHFRWMNDGTTTDVLTFDLRDEPIGRRVDGEILVCLPEARRAAREHGGDWRAELLLYVVHGCLHLCGHDDHSAAEYKRMHAAEDRILAKLGWGAVFSSGETGRRPSKRRGGRREGAK